MPIYSQRGQILAGIGTAPVSVDKTTIGTGGIGGWYNNETVIYNRYTAEGGWNVVSHGENSLPTIVFAGGANHCDAGGNVWAAWNNQGLYISTGYHLPSAGPGTVGPDGAVAYVPDYQVGIGMDVREYTGSVWQLSAGIVYDPQLLGQFKAIWRDNTLTVHTNNLPEIIPTITNAFRPRAVFVRNEWWVVYWSQSMGMVCRPFSSNLGYIIGPGDKFNHDARQSGNNIEMCFAYRAGEHPSDIDTILIDLSLPRVLLDPGTVPPIEPPVIPPIEPPEEEVKSPQITVDNWTLNELKDGREFVFHDRENPELDYGVRVYISEGSMYAEMWNKEGVGRTGARRAIIPCDHVPPVEPPNPIPPNPNPIPPTQPGLGKGIKLAGDKFFRRQDGSRVTIIESSEFSLFKRYLDNDWPTYNPVVEQRRNLGFNTLRVWLLNDSVVAFRNGVQQDGIHPNQYPDFYSRLTDFVDSLSDFIIELTVFTQTQTLMPNEQAQQSHLNAVANAVDGRTNVLLELVNENDQHDNATSPNLTRPPGNIIISHGSNGADATGVEPHWDYQLYHTNGLSEWQRKTGHNAMEKADVYGPPCISNENTRFPDNDSSVNHAFDAMAGAALLCAGACYHSQGGKFSRVFDPTETTCAKAWVDGANSVPLEFQAGQYARHDEMNSDEVIRAYSRTLSDGRSHLVKIRK